MGPLFAEIFDHILPVVTDDEEKEDRGRPPAKLAIYSGHDSTIMKVLSALGPKVWNGDNWPLDGISVRHGDQCWHCSFHLLSLGILNHQHWIG